MFDVVWAQPIEDLADKPHSIVWLTIGLAYGIFVGMKIFYPEPTFAISSLKTYIRTNILTTTYLSKKAKKAKIFADFQEITFHEAASCFCFEKE